MRGHLLLLLFAFILFEPPSFAQWNASSMGNRSHITHGIIDAAGMLFSCGRDSGIYVSADLEVEE